MSGTRQRGRPRSLRSHAAILEATRDLLAEGGYEHLTVDAIATRAGVGRQTVYRWWPSKAAVVAEATVAGLVMVGSPDPPGDTGDITEDLRVWLQDQVHRLANPALAATIRGLAAAAADSGIDADRLSRQLIAPRRDDLIKRLSSGVRQGQVRADADLGAVADMVDGLLLVWVLTRRAVPDTVEGVLTNLLVGIVRTDEAAALNSPAESESARPGPVR
ncbi:TetR/AcrR family transcriptional regulator [Nocardia sp. NPDC055321]